MKKLIVLFLFLAAFLNAQDIIYKTDGSEIQSKVIEISEDLIKYKKISNLDGPLYSIAKNEVFMIVYENGEREVFKSKVENHEANVNQKIQDQAITNPPAANSVAASTESMVLEESSVFSIMFKLGYFAPAADVVDQIYGGGLLIGVGPGIWFPSGLGVEVSMDGFFKSGEPIVAIGLTDAETEWSQLHLKGNLMYRVSTENPNIFPYFGAGITYAKAIETTTGKDIRGNEVKKELSVDGVGFDLVTGFQYEGIFLEVNYVSVKDPDIGGFSAMLGLRIYLK